MGIFARKSFSSKRFALSYLTHFDKKFFSRLFCSGKLLDNGANMISDYFNFCFNKCVCVLQYWLEIVDFNYLYLI